MDQRKLALMTVPFSFTIAGIILLIHGFAEFIEPSDYRAIFLIIFSGIFIIVGFLWIWLEVGEE